MEEVLLLTLQETPVYSSEIVTGSVFVSMVKEFQLFRMWKQFATLTSLIHFTIAMEICSSGYEQVPNTFLSSFDKCRLGTYPLQVRSNIGSIECLSRCTAMTNCSLACYNGSSCLLSSALVAPYWIPTSSVDQSLLPFPGFECYSSWIFLNDLTSKIYSVSSSTPVTNQFKAEYAVDGYYCDTWDTHFQGAYNANNWFEIDMGKAYSILKVVVKLRGVTGRDPLNYFSDIRISVGNLTGQGIYVSYTTIGSFTGIPTYGKIMTFQQTNFIVGRYIGIQDYADEYFTIGEVKVIGYII